VTARILDGRALAETLRADVARRVAALARPPSLAVVLVGDDPASSVYVRRESPRTPSADRPIRLRRTF
jgi:methylenetetrahydrofolate dehydrogenase (NADP+)/methenyltetrahydrofolate cyclohydrolase